MNQSKRPSLGEAMAVALVNMLITLVLVVLTAGWLWWLACLTLLVGTSISIWICIHQLLIEVDAADQDDNYYWGDE